ERASDLLTNNTDQVIFLPSPVDAKAFRIVVVPSAAAGASTITKTLPKLMVLDVPREHKLDGTMGENAGPYDTAEDVIERVFNDKSMMGGHGKHVIKSDPEEFISNVGNSERRGKGDNVHTRSRQLATAVYEGEQTRRGFLYLLPTGLFYGWKDPIPYLPHELVKSVEIYEGAKTKKTFDLVIHASEPYYHSGQLTEVPFKGLSKQDLEPVKRQAITVVVSQSSH
ncbi:hypothetical protein D6D25_06917, partial [Aureobasidium pullulans]